MTYTIHWKAPLQAKGFLRIVEIILAILAFSLTAGFTVENTYTCTTDGLNTSFTVESSYPYDEYKVTSRISSSENGSQTLVDRLKPDNDHSAAAEFFVAWGVLSMIYCIVAILVYMLFSASEEMVKINNILIIIDFGLTIFWAVMWFIASVAWAAESNNLSDDLKSFSSCGRISGADPRTYNGDYQTFIQANISIVFGFLNTFVWGCHVWWVLIDTVFWQKLRGNRGGGGGGGSAESY